MENASPFIDSKLNLLTQVEINNSPNLDQSWMRFQQRQRSNRSKRIVLTFVASLFLALSLLPQPRAWAQQAWTTYVLGAPTNIPLDFATNSPTLLLPNIFPFYPQDNLKQLRTSNRSEAATAAGFPVPVLSLDLHQPTFKVTQVPALEHTIDRRAIDIELSRLHRDPVAWPDGLDGAHLRVIHGNSVISRYGKCPAIVGPWDSCAFLYQSRIPELHLSVPIALSTFTAFSLELAGLSRSRATQISKFSSGYFLPLEENNSVLQRTSVQGAAAVLVTYPTAPNGEQAFNLQWQAQGFLFSLFGRNPKRAIALAESLH